MSAFKQQASSYHEDERFLSHTYSSKDEFVREYKKFYYGKTRAKDLYLLVLTKLENAVLEGNIGTFKRLGRFIDYISDIENQATLKTYYDDPDNPIKTTNLVILACKHNRVEILKYVFGNSVVLENLSSNIGKDVLTSDDKDETCHDAFYYAILCGNVELLDTLINKWPGNYFATRAEELDEVLSRAYEELKLKNVLLSQVMEAFVENKLINLRFFSERTRPVRISVRDNINNIKERIDLLIEKIYFLKSEFSNVANVDEKFLFVARFIAQNIHVLKRQLRLTYDRLPWEEIEFCLVSFISSFLKQQDINLFYRTILNKNKVLNYLETFAKKLEIVKFVIEGIEIGKLAILPKLNRDEVVAEIINIDPEFEELYNDYQRIRDIYSLEKISDYLNLALSTNPKEREGQLIITRALQVIGEYLKNTLESPNLSNTTSELLLLSLPKNTRKVIIDLRNSLSHAYSLSKRTEIEENTDANFFIGVQNDTKRIESVITDILLNNKIKMIVILMKNILVTDSVDEIKEVGEILRNVELNKLSSSNMNMTEHEKIEKLIRELNDIITDQTIYEQKIFKEINDIFSSVKSKLGNLRTDYTLKFSYLQSFCCYLTDNYLDSNSIFKIKMTACVALNSIFFQEDSHSLQEIIELSIKISSSARLRIQGDNLDKVNRITYEIFNIADLRIGDIKWIEKLREKLCDKGSVIPVLTPKATCDVTEDEYNKQLAVKLSELKTILPTVDVGGELIEKLSSYKSNKKLQAAVEMLVLDIMSILGRSEKHLENNLLFLDDNTPLLTGKCLRNHLAHGNTLLDVLLSDPSIAVIMNAEKLISENVVKSKKKVGKLVKDDPSKVKDKYDQGLIIITNREKMFTALQEGNLEDLKDCLQKGADINARSINSCTTLHFAAQGPNLEVVKFIFGQNPALNVKDMNGQSPLHVAAAHGRTNIVKFLLTKSRVPVDDPDNSRKTPLHMAAKFGHKDTVVFLLKKNASIATKDSNGYAPLHYAVHNNHIDVAKILFEKEANVDVNESTGGYTCLHLAAELGHLELVNFLLENGANVDAEHDKEGTPLHPAAINGHHEIVLALIRKGADVNARVLDGCTPLLYAAQFRHLAVANLLLEHGAIVDIVDKVDNKTPLHFAVENKCEEIVETLLKYNANANIATVKGKTPLHLAVRSANLKIVASLLKHGVDIHAKDKNQRTPLHYAAEDGCKEVAELLLKNGAKINAEDYYGLSPLHIAALKGREDVVTLLIENKAEIDRGDVHGSTALYAAAQTGNKGVIEILVKNKANVNAKTYDNQTPLHIAALNGHRNVVAFLIENKAEVNAKFDCGLTPLHGAVNQGHQDIVKLLIENGAKVNTDCLSSSTKLHPGIKGATLLHVAADLGHKEIVEILVKNGVDVDANCNNGTALLFAVRHHHKEIVEVLIANGADVNVENGSCLFAAVHDGNMDIIDILLNNKARIDVIGPKGMTVLHLAAIQGFKEVVNTLISRGSAVDAVMIGGATPLQLAAEKGNEEAVEILIANKANVNISNVYGSALHLAARQGNANVVDVLLNNGAKTDCQDCENRTPLELAVAHGHLKVVKLLLRDKIVNINVNGISEWKLLDIAKDNLEIVKYLVDKGANIHGRDAFGSKLIHIATRDGYLDTVKFYLSKGLNINEQGADNQTLLHYATMKDAVEVLKYLIDQGADVNAKDNNGITPLHFASLFGYKDLVVVLLENGAAYNAVDNRSRTPLDMTEEGSIIDEYSGESIEFPKNEDVVNLLLSTEKLFQALKRNSCSDVENYIKEGAFVNAKNAGTETTPLHYAAWKGCDEIVDILLQNKANPNAVCSKGFTPLHYAAKFSHLESIKILLCHGAIYNVVSENGKTPLDFTADKSITSLLKLVDESFRKVKIGNAQVMNDLNKIKDNVTLKAIMNACDRENKTLIAVAPQSNSSLVEKLKQVSQGDVSGEIELALALLNQRDFQIALNILERLHEKRKQIFGPDNPATLEIRSHIAEGLYRQGDYPAALRMFEEILQKQIAMLGQNNRDTLDTRTSIALVLYRQGKNDEAYAIYKDVYQKQKDLLGPNHEDIVDTQFHMAMVLQSQGKYDEALEINKAVYEFKKNTLGRLNINTVCSQNNIATVLSSQGKYEEALKVHRKVFEKRKQIFGINHGDTMKALHNIASVLHVQKKYPEALKTFQQVLDIQKKILPENHHETLKTQLMIAEVLMSQVKWVAALKVYKECYNRRMASFGPNDPEVLYIAKKIEIIDLASKFQGRSASQVFEHLQTDLNVAASNGDLQTVRRLLRDGADVNSEDIDGRTPLHFAVSNGHVRIVNILLESDADVTHATCKGNTPLHTATSKSNKEIVDILLQHVSRDKLNDFVNAKTTSAGTSSLHVAAKNGSLDVVKSLLQHGATYNIANKDGKMPIDLSKDQETVNLLKLIDDLFKNVKRNSTDVIKKLKSVKADEFLAVTNARNNQSHGLLQVAIVNKHKNIASVLLEMLKKSNQN